MSEKDTFIKKMETRIDQANAEVERYKAKAAEAGADVEIKYGKTLDELRAKREAAVMQLDELKAAGDDALGDIQRNLENLLDDFDVTSQRS